MASVEIRIEDNGLAWNKYVATHPHATSYHQYEWLAVIANSFGHRAIPLAATIEGHMVGVLPLMLMNSRLFGKFMVSLPFVNYGGVLGDDEEIEQALWHRAVEWAREERAAYLEARHVVAHPFIEHRKQH